MVGSPNKVSVSTLAYTGMLSKKSSCVQKKAMAEGHDMWSQQHTVQNVVQWKNENFKIWDGQGHSAQSKEDQWQLQFVPEYAESVNAEAVCDHSITL